VQLSRRGAFARSCAFPTISVRANWRRTRSRLTLSQCASKNVRESAGARRTVWHERPLTVAARSHGSESLYLMPPVRRGRSGTAVAMMSCDSSTVRRTNDLDSNYRTRDRSVWSGEGPSEPECRDRHRASVKPQGSHIGADCRLSDPSFSSASRTAGEARTRQSRWGPRRSPCITVEMRGTRLAGSGIDSGNNIAPP